MAVPFANIAHGCNSVLATSTALKLCDYVVTEAGFGADLGAEKFFDIKCRKAGLTPSATVIVATIRALKMHGGVAKDGLKEENVAAVAKGCDNLKRHIENVRKFGVSPVVAINKFITDTDAEIAAVKAAAEEMGAKAFLCTHWADGGAGIEDLARHVVDLCDKNDASQFKPLYPMHVAAGQGEDNCDGNLSRVGYFLRFVCRGTVQGAAGRGVRSFPGLHGKKHNIRSRRIQMRAVHPTGHVVPVRELRLSAGAEFIVS